MSNCGKMRAMKKPAAKACNTAPRFTSINDEVNYLRTENEALKQRVSSLAHRNAWFEKQIFGSKSEKRIIENPMQMSFDALLGEAVEAPASSESKQTITYQRGTAKKQRPEDCVSDSGLRFSDKVPVQVIEVTPPELSGPEADQYEVIDTRITYRLAQRPASYVVLQYERPVVKRKGASAPLTTPAPANVLDNSLADVSLLVGLLVDKFQYHLPLYRQHQRIEQAGITLSRATLTNLVKRAIDLLRPVVSAQLEHVLRSGVLAMDETPIKAGRQGKGKLKQAYFWPLMGEADEIVFTYSASRGRQHIENTLKTHFSGTLLSDGYAAYARFAQANEEITHAQCWVHSRRQFVEAEAGEPDAVAEALERIGLLYRIEDRIREAQLTDEKKRQYRLEHAKPVVDGLFEWCERQLRRPGLTPRDPFARALHYVLKRRTELSVFLENPDLPLDTNHLERALRPIPMGRKAWLFCWTELGAEHVGIIQSLIVTCRLQGVDPYVYLTDVLLRVGVHPAAQVAELTPRLWKEKFASNPLRSDLDR